MLQLPLEFGAAAAADEAAAAAAPAAAAEARCRLPVAVTGEIVTYFESSDISSGIECWWHQHEDQRFTISTYFVWFLMEFDWWLFTDWKFISELFNCNNFTKAFDVNLM